MRAKDNIPTEVGEDLAKSGLTWEDVGARGWHVIDTTEPGASEALKTLLGFTSYNGCNILQACTSVLVIPYPNCSFSRLRLYPPLDSAKYLQPKGVAPVPYIAPEVAEVREKPHKPVIITEGEKKALCLIKSGFNAIGLPGVWIFKNSKQNLPFLDELEKWSWRERIVHVCFDSDAIYNPHVVKAEVELALNLYARGAKVFIIRLPQPDHQDKVGADDFIVKNGVEAFKEVYDKACPLFEAYSEVYYQEFIKILAKLHEQGILLAGQVEHALISLAKHWKIRKSTLEKDLKSYLPKKEGEESRIVEELEPCSEEVNGEELANEVEQILRRFVFLEKDEYYTTVTLWIFLTYCFDRFSILPMLLITSPLMRCGKTTLLSVLRGLVNKALVASNISPAAVYRTVEKYKPTLLLDEADTGLAQNEELRGIVNAGHTRDTAFVVRAGSKETNFEPERFDTFCPKAIAMIGKPAPTWIDRSFEIKMQRKPRDLCLEKLPHDFYETVRPLRQKLLKWTCGDLEQIDLKGFDFPNDRAADNWYPLFIIAYNLGEEWFEKAHQAVAIDLDKTEEDLKIKLLDDISHYFEEQAAEKVSSADLVSYLNNLKERPWPELRGGKGITQNFLANLLRDFQIKSKTIWVPHESKALRGYEREDFKKVFCAYLPSQSVRVQELRNDGRFEQNQSARREKNLALQNPSKSRNNLHSCTLALSKGGYDDIFEINNFEEET